MTSRPKHAEPGGGHLYKCNDFGCGKLFSWTALIEHQRAAKHDGHSIIKPKESDSLHDVNRENSQ